MTGLSGDGKNCVKKTIRDKGSSHLMAPHFAADFMRRAAPETAPDGHGASRYTSIDPET
jgi:hypothetical protein